MMTHCWSLRRDWMYLVTCGTTSFVLACVHAACMCTCIYICVCCVCNNVLEDKGVNLTDPCCVSKYILSPGATKKSRHTYIVNVTQVRWPFSSKQSVAFGPLQRFRSLQNVVESLYVECDCFFIILPLFLTIFGCSIKQIFKCIYIHTHTYMQRSKYEHAWKHMRKEMHVHVANKQIKIKASQSLENTSSPHRNIHTRSHAHKYTHFPTHLKQHCTGAHIQPQTHTHGLPSQLAT
jgi:hypothetical protein